MSRITNVAVSLLMMSLTGIAASQPTGNTSRPKIVGVANSPQRGTAKADSVTPIECQKKDRCDLVVGMSDTSSTAEDACTATVNGALHIPKGWTPKIVWTLDPKTDPKKREYRFHDEYGILLVDDKDSQLKPGKGGSGEDDISISPTVKKEKFHWNKHLNNVPNGLVQYLPIVLRVEADQSLTLCGTQDPRINNDGP